MATNLLTPNTLTRIAKADVDEKIASKISPMPEGLVNVLTKDEILDLHAFVESGGFKLPAALEASPASARHAPARSDTCGCD